MNGDTDIKWKQTDMVEVTLGEPDDFLKVRETLTRIGVASRQIVVCARAMSQQLNCSLDKYSSFKLIAKRIAIKNQIFENNQQFWIIKRLKVRGYIAGKYRINNLNNMNANLSIEEVISPKLYKTLITSEAYYEAEYDIEDDLKQLLELSAINHENLVQNNWANVLPIYPIEPVN